jgi:hypothetical protein
MKLALIKSNSEPNHHQVINNSQQQEEDRETGNAKRKIFLEPHLTVSGVCTTVCPEKSGT